MLSKPGGPGFCTYKGTTNLPPEEEFNDLSRTERNSLPHGKGELVGGHRILSAPDDYPYPKGNKGILLLEQEPPEIQPQRVGHQEKEQDHTYHLGVLQEFLIGLTTRDHFIEGE